MEQIRIRHDRDWSGCGMSDFLSGKTFELADVCGVRG